MAYSIERDETVTMAVRRIATEQLDEAIADLRGETERTTVDAVHDCRKRCKKTRGLLRLVRPSLGRRYVRANARVRDAAKELSATRDAQALAEAFDGVTSQLSNAERGRLEPVSAALAASAAEASAQVEHATVHVMRATELLTKVHGAIADWRLTDDGWAAIGPGLARNYRDGRRALAMTRERPTAEHFHEWRKRAKYAWYHVRLLEATAPTILAPLEAAFSDLGEALGDAHDLAVLRDHLRANPAAFGGDAAVVEADRHLGQRQADLEREALLLGGPLFVESPRRFALRLGQYWDLWQCTPAESTSDTM